MEAAADLATVIAAIIAALAIGFGYHQFRQTQLLATDNLKLQREMYAEELFLKFAEQMSSGMGGSIPPRGHPDFWKHSALLAITESVYRLTKGDTGWLATVTAMLHAQKPFLQATAIECETFNAEFIAHVKSVVPTLNCV